MGVKVIIRRRYPPDKQKALQECIREIRSLVPLQAGYMSSEYLKTIDGTDEILTISTWFSLDDWQTWFNSETRRTVQKRIDAIGGVETEYRLYRYITTR